MIITEKLESAVGRIIGETGLNLIEEDELNDLLDELDAEAVSMFSDDEPTEISKQIEDVRDRIHWINTHPIPDDIDDFVLSI